MDLKYSDHQLIIKNKKGLPFTVSYSSEKLNLLSDDSIDFCMSKNLFKKNY